MSVLIEALCLVVNRLSLELSFPTGADGFEAQANELEAVRYVVSDNEVIAVSVLDPHHLDSLLISMMEAGLVYTDGDGSGDFVFVDMEMGVNGPCTWLKTEAHRHGFRTAVHSSVQHHYYFATPPGWTPQQSWQLQRYDLRDVGPDRVLSLGHNEAGEAAVLDFDSGRVVTGPNERSPIVTVGEPTLPSPSVPAVDDVRLAAAQRLLGHKGIPYRLDTAANELAVLFALDDVPVGDIAALLAEAHGMPEESHASSAVGYEPGDDDDDEGDISAEPSPFALILEQLEKETGMSQAERRREQERERDLAVQRMFQPNSLISRKGRLRIVLSAGADEDTLRFTVSLPCVMQTPSAPDQLKRGITGGQFTDWDTSTVSVAITVTRYPHETWEQAVERGFTSASATGSRAAMQLSVWSPEWANESMTPRGAESPIAGGQEQTNARRENTKTHGGATDTFFDDFEQRGAIHQALAKHSLVRQAFEETVRDTLWYRDDYGADAELLAMPIYLVLLDGIAKAPSANGVHAALRKFREAFPPFNGVDSGHFFDFVVIDVQNRIVIGFGFGRKDRIFGYVSLNGGAFEALDMHDDRYCFTLCLALFERVRRRMEVLAELYGETEELDLEDEREEYDELIRRIMIAGRDLVECFPLLDPLQLSSGDY